METLTAMDRETKVLLGTRLAAERLAWDEQRIREFEARRQAEADRRRQAKLPVSQRTHSACCRA